jgi:hypothetical protein
MIVKNVVELRESRCQHPIKRQRVERLSRARVEAAIDRGHVARVDVVVVEDIIGRCGNGTHGIQSQSGELEEMQEGWGRLGDLKSEGLPRPFN